MIVVRCSAWGTGRTLTSFRFLMTVFESPSRLITVVSSALTAVAIGAAITAVAARASKILRIRFLQRLLLNQRAGSSAVPDLCVAFHERMFMALDPAERRE